MGKIDIRLGIRVRIGKLEEIWFFIKFKCIYFLLFIEVVEFLGVIFEIYMIVVFRY